VPVRVLTVIGTRPEAIKTAPLVLRLAADPRFDARLCVTAQHRDLLDRVLAPLGIRPDIDLDAMRDDRSLAELTAAVMTGVGRALDGWRPDAVLVHGDTATTAAGALAAHLARVPVAHLEAGLRSGRPDLPWPEEGNRRLVGAIADLHLAPTPAARDDLLAENVAPDRIVVTGNTAVDAVRLALNVLDRDPAAHPPPPPGCRTILVTAHRRESLGAGLEDICEAVARLARRGDVEVAWPVHPNPAVRDTVKRRLGAEAGVRLLPPLDHLPFVALMRAAHLILTDSGGVQEEAPSLGVPVLVMRDVTERGEGLTAGTARLVGTEPDRIVAEATALLDDPAHRARMSRRHDAYGDGRACGRAADALWERYGR